MSAVLLIEDDDGLRDTLAAQLREHGFNVHAASGAAAIGVLRSVCPDVVVTDILMPGMDGLEIIRESRATHANLAIVAISGAAPRGRLNFLDVAREFGADIVLAKPVLIADLVAAIRRAQAQHPL